MNFISLHLQQKLDCGWNTENWWYLKIWGFGLFDLLGSPRCRYWLTLFSTLPWTQPANTLDSHDAYTFTHTHINTLAKHYNRGIHCDPNFLAMKEHHKKAIQRAVLQRECFGSPNEQWKKEEGGKAIIHWIIPYISQSQDRTRQEGLLRSSSALAVKWFSKADLNSWVTTGWHAFWVSASNWANKYRPFCSRVTASSGRIP